MNLTLHVWRQKDAASPGAFVTYRAHDIEPHMSFLEMLDVVNEELTQRGEEPVAFDHDCREGICGTCGVMINGRAHGGQPRTTTCQLHMRKFHDGDTIVIEPFRSRSFPVVRDLIVDRAAFDRIVARGGFIAAPTGTAPDANEILVPKEDAELAFDAATCIGCGACVAACPNASASLFTSAKIAHLAQLPQGQPERWSRVLDMSEQMDAEGFGGCTFHGECEAACPKGIGIRFISQMNWDYIRAKLRRGRRPTQAGDTAGG